MSTTKYSAVVLGALALFFSVFGGATAQPVSFRDWAKTPPMGWNSYDAFGDSVTEDETLKNALFMKDHLRAHGWNYIVVDFRWYDPQPTGDDRRLNPDRTGARLTADAAGRLLPAPNRFPSAADGQGFKGLADRIHAMGLKFGFHIMRGVPRQSVLAQTPIDGGAFTAADAGDPADRCSWCPDMFGVKNNAAGQAWYDSLFRQYAAWGTDFVKVDDLSFPYHASEIEMIRRAIDKCGRSIVFSASPGQTPVSEYNHIRANANMWRISGDFWDRWEKLDQQFDLLGKWQGVATPGVWPDADMIPFGRLAIRSKMGGADHQSRFTPDERQSLLSLWSITQSPLMLGASLTDLDADTLALITNDEILALDQDTGAKPARRVWQEAGKEIWKKQLRNGATALGCFNRTDNAGTIAVSCADLQLPGALTARNLMTHSNLGVIRNRLNFKVPAHGVVLLRVSPR